MAHYQAKRKLGKSGEFDPLPHSSSYLSLSLVAFAQLIMYVEKCEKVGVSQEASPAVKR
jgi:hypothetical protein